MTRMIFRLVILAGGVALAAYIVPGIEVDSPWAALKAAIVLGILNISIKPVLIILTLPVNILTLGLLTFVINGLLFQLAGWFVGGLHISGFGAAFLGALVVSVISLVFNIAFSENEER